MSLLTLLLACSPASKDTGAQPVPEQVEFTVALVEESPSSILVSWDLGELAVEQVQVRATSDRGDDITVLADPADGQVVVWGLHAEAEVQLQAELVGADDTWTEALDPLTTAPVPVDLPALMSNGIDPIPGELLLTTFVLEPPTAVMIDGQGEIRWWRTVDEVLPELTRVRFSPDGQSLVGIAANPQAEVERTLVRMPLAGGPTEVIPVDQAHHDFVFLPDGTLAILVHEIQEVDGETMVGDRIVELAPDDSQTVVFDAWTAFEPSVTGLNPAGIGFTHGNHLYYDEERDQYLVSFFSRWTIDRIDRATGDVVWEIGATAEADFTTLDGRDWFIEGCHGFQLEDGRLLYFENGTLDRGLSRAVEISIDEEKRIVEPLWAYDNREGLYSVSLGDVNRLDNGNTLVNFSTNGRIEAVTPDGEVQWQLGTDIGGIFGYMQRIPDPSSSD